MLVPGSLGLPPKRLLQLHPIPIPPSGSSFSPPFSSIFLSSCWEDSPEFFSVGSFEASSDGSAVGSADSLTESSACYEKRPPLQKHELAPDGNIAHRCIYLTRTTQTCVNPSGCDGCSRKSMQVSPFRERRRYVPITALVPYTVRQHVITDELDKPFSQYYLIIHALR